MMADRLPGGLADRGPPEGLDPEQLAKGIEVELEHTDDREIAREIALDHLTEDPRYYDHLEEMEERYQRDPLTEEQAFVILEPYFIVARELFVEYCLKLGLDDRVKKTNFECRSEMHDTPRHFAGATVDGRKVCGAPELAELPEDTVAAIFAHEFGHIVDHSFPGRFCLVEEEELVFVPEASDPRADQTRIARMRQWEARDDDAVELVADLIAEQAIGHRVGYSGPCMLQGLNRGQRRPKGLR